MSSDDRSPADDTPEPGEGATRPIGTPLPGARVPPPYDPYAQQPPEGSGRSGRGWMIALFVLLGLIAAAVLVWLFVFRGGGEVTISPKAVDFGDVSLGLRSAVQTVTVENSTSKSVTLTSIVVEGQNPDDFLVTDESTCSAGKPLAKGSSCAIGVRFKPKGREERTATLTVRLGNGEAPLGVNLHGTGVGEAKAELDQTRLDFGTVLLGKTRTLQVKLTNGGNAPLTIEKLAIDGDSGFSLAKATDCSPKEKVKAGKSCTIAVAFSPRKTGKAKATLVITYGAAGSPAQVALSGEGKGQAKVELSPTSLGFGDVEVGSTGGPQTATLKNTGTAGLTIGGFAFRGTDVNDFSVDGGTCVQGLKVKAGESCTIDVAFAPTASGGRSAILEISSSTGAVGELTVSGNGTAPPATTAATTTA